MCILLLLYVVSKRARSSRRRGAVGMASGSGDRDASRQAGDDEIVLEAREPNRWQSFWQNNEGALLILISEVFGSSMDATARYLQQGGAGFPTLQIIVFRMGITFVLSSIYMWWIKVPHFPFGNPEVRGWLVLRALFGFMGLFTLYYSVHYLPLSEATVLRFLIPLVTAWACHIFLGQSFTSQQLTAGLIALVGVIIMAHPSSLFGKVDDIIENNATTGDLDDVTSSQRLLAIIIALVGVFGASGAYTVIRVIGNRAHALMSVNYFALVATVGASAALIALPGTGFVMPRSAKEWILLAAMGVLGFVLQFLLTRGLQLDRSPKATSMLYTQVLFALGFDWAIWGVLPDGWSWVGGAVVVASTLWSALQKPQAAKEPEARADKAAVDEETALLGAHRQGDDGRRENGPATT